MKTIFLFLAVFGFGPYTLADRENSLFKKFPITDQVHLPSGEAVPMPFHIYGGEATLLIGTADAEALEKEIKGNNVSVAKVSPKRALVGLYVIHYSDTVIGTYDEVFITVLVNYKKPTGNNIFRNYLDVVKVFIPELQSPSLEKRNLGFFAWKLWVNSQLSMEAGREIWGYNKTLADIKMHTTDSISKLQVTDEEGLFFHASLKSILFPLKYRFPLRMDFLSTTPLEIKQTSGRAIIQADASIRALVNYEGIQLNPHHTWGKRLIDIGFRPKVWIQARNPSSIIFSPFPKDLFL